MNKLSKSALALLALSALEQCGIARAADSTQVLVTATVPSWVKLETAATVDLGNISNVETAHPITVSSNNTNQVTQVTVKQAGSSENHMLLSHSDSSKNDQMKVKVDVKEADIKDGGFSAGQIISKNFATSQAGRTMTLLLTPTSDFSKLESGQYQGSLSVTALIN